MNETYKRHPKYYNFLSYYKTVHVYQLFYISFDLYFRDNNAVHFIYQTMTPFSKNHSLVYNCV